MKGWILFILSVLFFIIWSAAGVHAGVITPGLRSMLENSAPGDEISVIITLSDQADINRFREGNRRYRRTRMVKALKDKAHQTQKQLIDILRSRGGRHLVSLWLINGLAITIKAEVIKEIVNHPLVQSIRLDKIISLSELLPAIPSEPVERNLDDLGVSAPNGLWDLGFRGQGVVVASMDSGVDVNHPDLIYRWRGGTNSWFDPNGEHDSPYDADGHGTQAMGIMVGEDTSGAPIGAAPEAKWIAVKIFNDAGNAPLSGIHQGFQWLLDPDGNSLTDDAPDVVNNSWGLLNQVNQCVEEFRPDLQTLKAAGITVVFAAGNLGEGDFPTSLSPANNPEGFAVGAVDDFHNIASFSSRGPSPCDQSIYPEVVAPGVNIYTSDLSFGGFPNYTNQFSGTSLAAAYASGVMALLLSAFPDLSVADLEAALINSATDLGNAGPDNDYGYGLINGLSAYEYLVLEGWDPCLPINVNFSVSPDPAAVGEPVTFTSTVSGGTLLYSYAWDVNGDAVIDCDTPDCVFTYQAFYSGSPELTITDSQGCSGYASRSLDVGASISGNIQDIDGSIVSGAVISVVEHPEINFISEVDGHFTLSGVPPNERVHAYVQGPADQAAEYVDTYSPYFTALTESIVQDAFIIRTSDMTPVIQTFNPDQSRGIIIGMVSDQTGDGVTGVIISLSDPAGNPVPASIGYMDTDGDWTLARSNTSQTGGYVIYNVPNGIEEIRITGQKAGWPFETIATRIYPY
ncbi:MAG: S8 family serine peptidase, partial [Deltaproteobacteria bacterium]|nr:S8 family serine peptidase [Deltaproteobacteria bacterium]